MDITNYICHVSFFSPDVPTKLGVLSMSLGGNIYELGLKPGDPIKFPSIMIEKSLLSSKFPIDYHGMLYSSVRTAFAGKYQYVPIYIWEYKNNFQDRIMSEFIDECCVDTAFNCFTTKNLLINSFLETSYHRTCITNNGIQLEGILNELSFTLLKNTKYTIEDLVPFEP
jgi:hypothetical protein